METPEFAQLLDAAIPSTVALLGAALTYAVAMVTGWLKARTKGELARQALEYLEGVVSDAVGEAERTAVRRFKASRADGAKLTLEEGREVLSGTVDVVKRHLGDEFDKIGKSIGGVFDNGRIRTMIEAEVDRRK